MPRRKVVRYPVVLTEHVFSKVRSIDMTLAEFAELIGTGEVIEERDLGDDQIHELILVISWVRPLHVAVVVDARHSEERIITVYEPDPDKWSSDWKRRRL